MSLIPFTHLHVHSQYSVLDGQASIKALVSKAKEDGMTAIALTDHGNMHGAKEFYDTCKNKKINIKPIIGVEAYVAQRTIEDKVEQIDRSGRHLILLAKNTKGYKNLLKLTSLASTKGLYYRPRIDKANLEKHSEGLIVTSACLGGEVPQKILKGDIEGAKESILWFKRVFGDDYYLELQRHPSKSEKMWRAVYEEQVKVNKVLIELSKELDVKLIAANDVHFVNEEDADAHDVMICLNTGADYFDPDNRMTYTQQEWFKTTAEMNELFKDVPEALQNTQEIVDKIEEYSLNSDPIMPEFDIPEEFGTYEKYKELFPEEKLIEDFGEEQYKTLGGDYEHLLRVKLESDYLAHLTYVGAKKLYSDPIPQDVKERLDFELNTVKTMGFPGYFLIVQDFINAARQMGVLVGPGRGSAAGSAVAYCVGITSIDPIKHDLLFERFLNPDRISMPDVDIDFDDDGRQLVLNWVAEKYGHNKVAHICTFGTMAAKSSIKDVGRVLKLPLQETERITKRIPDKPGTKLADAYNQVLKIEKEQGTLNAAILFIDKTFGELTRKKNLSNDEEKDLAKYEIYQIFADEINTARLNNDEIHLKTLDYACRLEGSVRHIGVHACGVLIGKDDLTNHIPLMPAPRGDAELLVTQYEGTLVESIGLLKMDFLGLRTLSIIKESLENIKLSKGIEIDLEQIPEDDEKTFQLFSKGETTAIFQFESPGMKKYLKDLKPNRFEDLVAMNALYRPGPIEYIPSYVNRKHGREKIEYDHPMMASYLEDTYGITVFQEQVMLLSRHLAGFTRGESDTLRKAMGKKMISVMAELKEKFSNGCKNNPEFMEGVSKAKLKVDDLIEKIWKDWEAFANYAFNKSHSVCYANLAYQTVYLKAHHPAEFMAGVLSSNLKDKPKIPAFMDECKRMAIPVLGPDVNESFLKFMVNKKGELRFGLGAIKGVGHNVVEEIISERTKNGPFTDIYDFVERINLQIITKRTLEALAGAGALDNLGDWHRAQYLIANEKEEANFIEYLIRYGNKFKSDKSSAQTSLFGSVGLELETTKPEPTHTVPFSTMEKLEREKELVGMYISSHPLDIYKFEIKHFCNLELSAFENINDLNGRNFTVGGMITATREGTTKHGKLFGVITLEDYSGQYNFAFFGKDYVEYGKFFKEGLFVLIKGSVVEPKYGNKTNLTIKYNSITLLEDALDKIRKLELRLLLTDIDEAFVTEIHDLMLTNKGNTNLYLKVIDPENNQEVNLFSNSIRVDLSYPLIQYFNENPNIEMSLS